MKRSGPPKGLDRRRRPYWTEFECPECSAENPLDDGIRVGDEVCCHYCQTPFRVRPVDDSDTPRFWLDRD